MRFLIDDQPVNTRTDWTHDLRPAQVARREFSPPGLPQRLVIASPSLPPDLVVTGFLEASAETLPEAISLVNDQVMTWSSLKGDGVGHAVTIHNRVYASCEVIEAATSGPVQSIGNGAVRRAFVFMFRMPTLSYSTVEEEAP